MRKLFFLLFGIGLISHQQLAAQPKSNDKLKLSVISSFDVKEMVDTNSIIFHIPNPDKPLLLFIFLSPECPLSKNYTLTLNQLFQQYSQQVQFYGCISGKSFTNKEIASFVHTYKVLFPFLVDEKKKFTHYLAATVTPEVILLDQEGHKVYSGAIDDWVQELGKQKLNVSKHYLQDAIDASLANKEVPVTTTTAYGCLINDY